MKKFLSLTVVLLLCVCLGLTFSACDEKNDPSEETHEHSFATEWSKDATHHWYVCEEEDCSEVSEKAEHTWNEGEITTLATKEADGVKTFTCTVCGETKTEVVLYVHEHQFAAEWSKDAMHHWHACADSDCTERADKAEHTWNEGEITTPATKEADGVKTLACTVCGQTKTEAVIYVHEHQFATEWSKDATHHWYACADVDCTESAEKAEHTWNEGVITTPAHKGSAGEKLLTCTVCGQTKTEEVPYVMDRTIANRIFSLLGYEENGTICVSVNADGMMLKITTHDLNLLVDEHSDTIVEFDYDDQGKLIHLILDGFDFPITEYDEKNRPTKTASPEIYFTYEATNVTLVIGEDLFTADEYGRCIRYIDGYGDPEYEEEYVLTFDETQQGIGTWRRVADEINEIYPVAYEDNTKLTKMACIEMISCEYMYEYEYNAEGLPTRVTYIEEPLSEEAREGYLSTVTYDEQDRIVSIVSHRIEGQDEIRDEETRYIYDGQGNLIEEKWLDANGNPKGGILYAYDEHGNQIKKDITYPDGRTALYAFSYDENNRKIKESATGYDENGTFVQKYEVLFEYHANDAVSKESRIEYFANGNKSREEIYEYYANGTRKRSCGIIYLENGDKTMESFSEYHESGRMTKRAMIYYSDGEESYREEVLYDEQGNPIE